MSLACMCLFPLAAKAQSAKVADKMVATVSNGTAKPELITYSDVLWQLALEPRASVENPSSADLNSALRRLIDVKLIEQEAGKLPTNIPTEQEVKDERDRIVGFFPSAEVFQQRLNAVGFSSITDDNFLALIGARVSINKYLDFRFRSFVVITPKEETDYYNATYLPRFREQNPGKIVPTLEQARADIDKELTEDKIASDLDKFLESARERAEIVILNAL